jgi:hypothetical protein
MKRDTPEHPKMHDLADRLQINLSWATGIMVRIWHHTAKFAPRGDIGRYSDLHVAKSVSWPHAPEALIDALVKSRWLDESEEHRLIVHDWPDHCEDGVHTFLAKRRLTFANGRRPHLKRIPEAMREEIHMDYDAGVEYPSDREYQPVDIGNPPHPELWDEFWEAWPRGRKQNKLPALKAWCKLVKSEDLAQLILRAVHIHKQPGGALANPDPDFIPYAVTWLNNRRWEDEYRPSKAALEDTFSEREPTLDDLLDPVKS